MPLPPHGRQLQAEGDGPPTEEVGCLLTALQEFATAAVHLHGNTTPCVVRVFDILFTPLLIMQEKEKAKVVHDISGFAHKVHSLVTVTSFDEVWMQLYCEFLLCCSYWDQPEAVESHAVASLAY